MKTGQKTLAWPHQKDKDLWERWYEVIEEEEKIQSNKDVTVQCIDFCEVTTSDVHAVFEARSCRLARRYTPATSPCSGGNCGISGKPTSLPTDPPCSQVPGLSRCIHTATGIAGTKSQEAQGLLEEIRRQTSVFVLSGPATVITNVATAIVFLAKGRSTESVSRVVRTARTAQEKTREGTRRACILQSHT